MSLLEAACNSDSRDGAQRRDGVAKRYRLNVQKIEDSVASEFEGRRVKRYQGQKAGAKQKLEPALQACHQRGA